MAEQLAHPYVGVFIMLFLSAGIFFGITLLVSFISSKLSNRDNDKLKQSMYECGPTPNKQPNRISSHFYKFALLFILFDVEIIFMYPWALNFKTLGIFGFVEMIMFISLLSIGFIYAWKKGALKWHGIK
ncbi:MAG: NADH ubiquinone oxidoreductase chain A (EC [uncultured Campylobacterales bacterium]|uniref:NADH-quinone oxidoreductase subunit A n=1 Tax=uncultured Campylobacterales bacterium TaxID=352960 RepID=A0A6S6SE67_9BACT|nr:MAG: NADH ubiquinone oxidoreductase chain A (EC [uncultured Campylobacterales bacterium]